MCNLYRLHPSSAEVAQLAGAIDAAGGSNRGAEVYPGYPGLVIAEGEVRQMVWGFPLALKSRKTGAPLKPKPINNARSDKLDSRFWNASYRDRRCLIPVSAFAEAEGAKGRMTRTWLSVPGEDPFTCAGIWRDSGEWGPCYSMVMTEPSAQSAAVHDRMPVILASRDRDQWLMGSPEEALALCRPWAKELMIQPTGEPWTRR